MKREKERERESEKNIVRLFFQTMKIIYACCKENTHTHELLSHLILEFNRYNCAENLKITAFKLNNY